MPPLPKQPAESNGRVLIALRSRMTLDERDALKVLAIRERRDMSELVAEALRNTYNLEATQ